MPVLKKYRMCVHALFSSYEKLEEIPTSLLPNGLLSHGKDVVNWMYIPTKWTSPSSISLPSLLPFGKTKRGKYNNSS